MEGLEGFRWLPSVKNNDDDSNDQSQALSPTPLILPTTIYEDGEFIAFSFVLGFAAGILPRFAF